MELELESGFESQGAGVAGGGGGGGAGRGRRTDGGRMVVYHFGVVGVGDIIFGIGGAKPSIDTRGSRGQQTYLDGVFIQAEFTFIPNQTNKIPIWTWCTFK